MVLSVHRMLRFVNIPLAQNKRRLRMEAFLLLRTLDHQLTLLGIEDVVLTFR